MRYLIYLLRIARGILAAKLLGPYYFGTYAFLLLVLQYLSYTNLGVQYSLNLRISTSDHKNRQFVRETVNSALFVTTAVFGFLFALGLSIELTNTPLFEKYLFSKYALAILTIAGLYHFQQVFSNVYRLSGNLRVVAFVELINVVLPFTVLFLFEGSSLIGALVVSTLLAAAIGFVLFIYSSPVALSLEAQTPIVKDLLIVGIQVLAYNVSYFLFVLAGWTIVGSFYPVEAMGLYSLATSITIATMLGFDALTWTFYPKILSHLREGVDDRKAGEFLRTITEVYGSAVFLVVFCGILIMPVVLLFLHEYQPVRPTLSMLLLSQGVLAAGFGCTSLALARKRQMHIALLSILSMLLVVVGGFAAIYFNLGFFWVAAATLVGSLGFTIAQARFAQQLLSRLDRGLSLVSDVLPPATLLSLAFFASAAVFDQYFVLNALGIGVFLTFNWRKLLRGGKLVLEYSLASRSAA